MRILSRYIFREIISSALLGTLLATFVIFLQGGGQLFALLVRSSAKPETVAYLFALAMPPLLPLTIPFGVLVGILIGLGRMSTDGEITAMRAAGLSSRKVVLPVLAFALLAAIVAGACSLWLTPKVIRKTVQISNQLAASHLTAAIQPRVFDEQFEKTILYVGDVKPQPGTVVVWRNVFLADLTPPEQRSVGLREKGEGPRVTVAREAIAVPDPLHNRIQLSLRDASTHEVDKDGVAYDSTYQGDQVLEAAPPSQVQRRPFSEMSSTELRQEIGKRRRSSQESIEARVEWNRRLSLPIGCLMLALVGIPLGVSSRKGGKSTGYVTAIFLAFFCYHLAFISLIGLAKKGVIPVELGAWAPDAAFALAGLILIARLEKPKQLDLLGPVLGAFAAVYAVLRPRITAAAIPINGGARRLAGGSSFPQLIDTYVLTNFLFYFALLLASFVLMTQVYQFFELLSDIVKNRIPMSRVFTYLAFLTPKLIYDTLPVSVLVAVLVTFGVLTKHNEVIAFKACGVSLRRLASPVLLMSLLFSVSLFAFDHYYVPEANLKQDAIRNEIKGRPVQSYLRPDRRWIFGTGSRIFYYKYYDTAENAMLGVSVYELDPSRFQLNREISAERAQWLPASRSWAFQNGWARDIRGIRNTTFQRFQTATFAELNETPEYFRKEVKQYTQMDFQQLGRYIGDLRQSGFDTVRLRVQLHKKFSVPLFALIMAMISAPFGFLVGSRGAMAGIGVSIAIAMAYWGVGRLFEEIGNVNLLPPAVAAWAPDALFSLAGLYLLLRMRS